MYSRRRGAHAHIFSIKYSHQQIYVRTWLECRVRPHSTPCMIYRPLRKVLITTTPTYFTGKYKHTTDTIPPLPTSTHIDKRPVNLYALISFNNMYFCFRYYFPFLFILHIVPIGHMLSAKHKCVCAVCSTKLWTKSFSGSNFEVLERRQYTFCSCLFWENLLIYRQRFGQSTYESSQKLSAAIITVYELQKNREFEYVSWSAVVWSRENKRYF